MDHGGPTPVSGRRSMLCASSCMDQLGLVTGICSKLLTYMLIKKTTTSQNRLYLAFLKSFFRKSLLSNTKPIKIHLVVFLF